MATATTLIQDLQSVVKDNLRLILENIALTYHLNDKELKERYMGELITSTDSVDNGNEKKKRGRKKKQKDEFIETEEYEYEGVKYLVDGNNNVYTYNIEEPTLVGEKLVDGTIKMFPTKWYVLEKWNV